ncbi:MAG: LytTR family transcriptional regulator DNA-binding domain-containing protein [Sphingomonadaceae bacterium]|nr:LytTR family transcriptional regulator DNA-binding domain-containing protein [Altererythrobacter sp.]MCP5391096.1 LytTR family transcriptional regulator DNA-binding domain-containing protein [Sphingomonadaceae bacterium]MCP5393125.1 LytTR family transcriptional regulator DNA-binding domain-containing protein [Sphingomonadaceae bacterium]
MSVIGVVMALIGPFGSFDDPLAIRLMVWLALAYAGYCIYAPMGWVVDRLHQSLALPRAGLWIAAIVIATIPMTLIVWSVGQLGYPSFRLPSAETFLIQYAYVFVVGAGITAVFNMIQRPDGSMRFDEKPDEGSGGRAPPPAAPDTSTDASRFLDRLPAHLGTDLLALEMEDHYVRAHTALGSELVLMRLRDAMAELDGIEGMQVHRSWWVARHAVEDVQREGRSVRLVLPRGIIAPVSRANVAVLKDAGWI